MMKPSPRAACHADDRLRQPQGRRREIHFRGRPRDRTGRAGRNGGDRRRGSNKPVSRWANRQGKPTSLTVVADVTEDAILDQIDQASLKAAFVIVDLEGTASLMVGQLRAANGRSKPDVDLLLRSDQRPV